MSIPNSSDKVFTLQPIHPWVAMNLYTISFLTPLRRGFLCERYTDAVKASDAGSMCHINSFH
jgi:hypothetical protein